MWIIKHIFVRPDRLKNNIRLTIIIVTAETKDEGEKKMLLDYLQWKTKNSVAEFLMANEYYGKIHSQL
jgi:hypothetical protein